MKADDERVQGTIASLTPWLVVVLFLPRSYAHCSRAHGVISRHLCLQKVVPSHTMYARWTSGQRGQFIGLPLDFQVRTHRQSRASALLTPGTWVTWSLQHTPMLRLYYNTLKHQAYKAKVELAKDINKLTLKGPAQHNLLICHLFVRKRQTLKKRMNSDNMILELQ